MIKNKNVAFKLFKEFTENTRSGGLVLLVATIFSLLATNFFFPHSYHNIWHTNVGGITILHWINDALMAIFFLLIGLELKREIQEGELSTKEKAMLPVLAALGGMIVPAFIYITLNFHTGNIAGVGIPMATDIAFSLGVLSLLGKIVPLPLKIFLTALAVADDLGAIIIIAIFYTKNIQLYYLLAVMGVALILLLCMRFNVNYFFIYLIGGILLWIFMHKSGVHATLAGVLLAFLIPSDTDPNKNSLSNILQHYLNKPVTFFILPLFALANTSIEINAEMFKGVINYNTIGIALGLFIGKPLGITFFTYIGIKLKWFMLPTNINIKHILGVGFIAGIGFTMSIFISILAFEKSIALDYSKIAVLFASLCSGIVGYIYLNKTLLR